jgi:hypothetical protein
MKQATIILDMYKTGIHVTCEETGHDEFIQHGNGNRLMEILNTIQDVTDPDSTWELTEKGKYLANLMDNEGLLFEEAMERTEKEYKTK